MEGADRSDLNGYQDEYPSQQGREMVSCFLGIQNMTTNILKKNLWHMVEFSADDLFGIGSQPACEKLGPGTAQFAILEFYIETMPTFYKMGACLPTQCSSNALKRIIKRIEPHIQ